jgi:outer membrane protein OmpA-like peptidoglycan-associated protein
MAFDLNKNDGPVKSKFDLSKADESKPDLEVPKKSNKTILVIVLLVVVGVAIYFFTKGNSNDGGTVNNTTDTTKVASTTDTTNKTSDSATSVVSSTTATSAAPSISAPTTFPKASAEVGSVDDAKVSQVVNYLKSNASAVVTIEGYASSEGDASFNQQLSEQRAKNFAKYLISKGVSADNIKTTGKGTENPIASNDDESGRAQNRRVEVKF